MNSSIKCPHCGSYDFWTCFSKDVAFYYECKECGRKYPEIGGIEKYHNLSEKAIDKSEKIYSLFQDGFELPLYRFQKGTKTETKGKEAATMKISYNGFTGELLKLERTHYGDCRYALDIYDSDKNAKISFTGVKLEDVKFLGVVVSFGG